jgi:hypothetical protein
MLYTVLYMSNTLQSMVRTQVYLTPAQAAWLKTFAKNSGKQQSSLIREAVDALRYTTSTPEERAAQRKKAIEAAFGMWADYPEVEEILKESRKTVRARGELQLEQFNAS